MRAVEITEDRSLAVVQRPAPEPGPGQVVVDIAYCGIGGSDLHFRDIPALFPAGTVPGHEMSGSVSAVGGGVAGWSIRGSFTYRRSDFDEAIGLLAAGRITSDALIGGVAALEEAEETFQALMAPGNLRTKVLLDPRRIP